MTPFERAARWHEAHSPDVPLVEVVEAHFQHGVVYSDGRAFVLGRRVSSSWTENEVLNFWKVDPQGDAWHVWLWAGSVQDWRRVVPCPLPWLQWHRRGILRRFRFPAGK